MSPRRRGVNYDVGTNYSADGALSRQVWRTDLVTAEIRAIRHDLRANAVGIFGTGIDRLVQAGELALDQGLEVWLQPRLVDGDGEQTLEQLATMADAAEAMRQRRPGVILNLGCELSIFMTGIVPGATHAERAAHLASPLAWPMVPRYNRRLNAFLAEATVTARARFAGQITYSAGLWERVQWQRFDVVGLDYYRLRFNRVGYARRLRKFHRWGKPVVVTEFGSGSYRGAAEKGPTSHDVIDFSGTVPRLTGTYVRDEQVQADQLSELLDVYETEGVYGAFVFEFIEPYNPHSPDPRSDADMAGYGIVTVLPGDDERPYRWKPKAAFHMIAARYARGDVE